MQRLFLPINELKSNMIKSPGLSHKTPFSSTSTQSKATEFSKKKKISNTNKNHEALNLEIPHPGMKCLMFNIDFSHASSLVMIVCAQF